VKKITTTEKQFLDKNVASENNWDKEASTVELKPQT
jgi:hypothetical protein